jgi:hypothetical protein
MRTAESPEPAPEPASIVRTDLLLPPGSVLLHIGPYKTGSTSLQYALFARQEDLRQHEVIFPGNTHRQRRPGWGVLGWTPRGRKNATVDDWDELVASLQNVGENRVCLTTEDLGWASGAQAARIVTDLGVSRVHVVVVVRRLDRLLPSEWQERIKTFHQTKSYVDWLQAVVGDDRSEPSAHEFWASHDVGRQLRNWTAALPPQQMTVVVTDDSDRRFLSRTFEQMLGLPDGFLHSTVDANASLSEERVELLRRLNSASEQHQWSDRLHAWSVEDGAKSALMETPRTPLDHKLSPTPAWAIEKVRTVAEEHITAIAEAGVNVVGDLACLHIPADATPIPARTPTQAVSIDVASSALEAVLEGAVRMLAETRRNHRRELKAVRQELHDARQEVADSADRLGQAQAQIAATERAHAQAAVQVAELRQLVDELRSAPAMRASRLMRTPVRTLRGRVERAKSDRQSVDGER